MENDYTETCICKDFRLLSKALTKFQSEYMNKLNFDYHIYKETKLTISNKNI